MSGDCVTDRVRVNKMKGRGEGQARGGSGWVSVRQTEFEAGKWRAGERLRPGDLERQIKVTKKR